MQGLFSFAPSRLRVSLVFVGLVAVVPEGNRVFLRGLLWIVIPTFSQTSQGKERRACARGISQNKSFNHGLHGFHRYRLRLPESIREIRVIRG